jgi:hypothetical protein
MIVGASGGDAAGAPNGESVGGSVGGGGASVGCPGQTRIRSPDGSMRGPCQLAQPGANIAQTVASKAQSEVRHFQRSAMLKTIHVRRGAVAPPSVRRRPAKLYRLKGRKLPFGNVECCLFSTSQVRCCGVCRLICS